MTQRIALYFLLAAAALIASCGYGFSDGKLTLDFSASQIQSAIAPKFPQENCPTPLSCIKLQNPKVTLAENSDRITMAFDLTVSLLGQPVTGTAVVSAKPRYQAASGEIYLDDSQIQNLALQGVSSKATNAVMQYGSVLAQTALQRTPIYGFKSGQAEKLAKMGIADVKVTGGKLRVTLDPTFAQGAAPKTP